MTTKNTTTNKYAEHDSLYICLFFDESLGGAREGTSASKKHTNKNDQNKSEYLSVSGRNFIVASTIACALAAERIICTSGHFCTKAYGFTSAQPHVALLWTP
jgi:hypothetical protein